MKNLYLVLLFITQISFCQQTVKLYPGKAPGSETWDWKEKELNAMPGNRMFYNVSEPEILIYKAPKEKANGAAFIVAPGGAFHILSIDSEGINVAKWLNERGITAIVIKYRVVKSNSDNPFAELMPLMRDFKKLDEINAPVVEMATKDGIEAMKYAKAHAIDLNINPNRIGFMGFSAGGTLTMSVLLSAPQNLKPNFIAPMYLYGPAVIGKEMPIQTTPAFIGVATDDELGFVPHSIALYQKWFDAKLPAELHIYDKGGHGFGTLKKNTSSDNWLNDFENWLKIILK